MTTNASVTPTNTTTYNANDHLVCTCNNQLTVGQTGNIKTTSDALWLGLKSECSQSFPTAHTVENSVNTTTAYLGSLCNAADAKANGYVTINNDACNNYLLHDYLPIGALSSANAYYSDASSPLYGKFNVPVCNYMYKTTKVLGRCMPFLTQAEMSELFSVTGDGVDTNGTSTGFAGSLSGYTEQASEMISDISKCWYIILTCVLIAFCMGMTYLCLMSWCAQCIVFSGLVLCITTVGAFCGALYYYWIELDERTTITPQLATYDNDVQNANICLGFLILFCVIEGIVTCMVVCMCSQIRLACTVLELAADGVMDMPILIFYPIAESIGTMCAVTVWCFGAAYIATAGDVKQEAIYGYAYFEYDDTMQYIMWFWLFGLFWITEFIAAVGFMVVAMCFCIWFFTPEPKESENAQDVKNKPPTLKVIQYTDPTLSTQVEVYEAAEIIDETCCMCLPANPCGACSCCCCSSSDDSPKYEDGTPVTVTQGGMGEDASVYKNMMTELQKYEAACQQASINSATAPADPWTPEQKTKFAALRKRRHEIDLLNIYEKHKFQGILNGRNIGGATGRMLPSCIIGSALTTTFKHHLGTCAFGSLIIAIIKMLQFIVEYVDQKQKEMAGEPPVWWQAIFCLFRCCLCCLECCMRFLNQTAYILTCINSTWFCSSACHAAAVLFSKIDYVFVTVSITSGMLVFGKIAIATSTAAIGAYWAGLDKDSLELNSIVAPVIVILIVAYTVALLFTEVYEMGIDTVLMCYLEADNAGYAGEDMPAGIGAFLSKQESEHHNKMDHERDIANQKAADLNAPGVATQMT